MEINIVTEDIKLSRSEVKLGHICEGIDTPRHYCFSLCSDLEDVLEVVVSRIFELKTEITALEGRVTELESKQNATR